MKILIACEESQAVCIEFRKLGFEAYSCDIQDCSGGHPEWHIKGDALAEAYSGKYDCMVSFPPCTALAVSGAAWFEQKRKDGRQQAGIDFFMAMVNAPVKHIAIENPVGIMSTIYRKPDQKVHPYYFGDPARKNTCLWLKNLPPLFHAAKPDLFNNTVTHVHEGDDYTWTCKKTGKVKRQPLWYAIPKGNGSRNKKRSKTFPGIAKAMAKQWSEYLINKYQTT